MSFTAIVKGIIVFYKWVYFIRPYYSPLLDIEIREDIRSLYRLSYNIMFSSILTIIAHLALFVTKIIVLSLAEILRKLHYIICIYLDMNYLLISKQDLDIFVFDIRDLSSFIIKLDFLWTPVELITLIVHKTEICV